MVWEVKYLIPFFHWQCFLYHHQTH